MERLQHRAGVQMGGIDGHGRSRQHGRRTIEPRQRHLRRREGRPGLAGTHDRPTAGSALGERPTGTVRRPDGFVGEAHGTNSDGSIVVGQTCRFSSLDQSAWIWTAPGGVQCVPVPRPRLGGAIGIMFSTSEDGRVIGGAHSFGLESDAVSGSIAQPSYLKDYLRAHGVPTAFDGWVNTGFITHVSPNGRILVGYGAGPRDFQGFIVILGDTP